MPQTKLLILLLIVMMSAAVTIYIGVSFGVSPVFVAIISIAMALIARFMLRGQ